MRRSLKYRFIAFLLLVVFSLNTLAGFACSIGIDLGYNRHHHDHTMGMDHMSHCQMMHHGTSASATHEDCCSGVVTQFNQLDKSPSTVQSSLAVPVFILSLSASFLLPSSGISPQVVHPLASVRRSCFLNDTAIRIAIQSFQI